MNLGVSRGDINIQVTAYRKGSLKMSCSMELGLFKECSDIYTQGETGGWKFGEQPRQHCSRAHETTGAEVGG